jgi:hypothetical protein
MRGFVTFAICFALLAQVWYDQNIFFRRYGLQDLYATFLNLVLLFTVLFYVYPLKFMFTVTVSEVAGIVPPGNVETMLEPWQAPGMLIVFGAGYLAVSLVSMLLHLHAWSLRNKLDLNDFERSIRALPSVQLRCTCWRLRSPSQ